MASNRYSTRPESREAQKTREIGGREDDGGESGLYIIGIFSIILNASYGRRGGQEEG